MLEASRLAPLFEKLVVMGLVGMQTRVPAGVMPDSTVASASATVAMQQNPIAHATAEQESFFIVFVMMGPLS
jgi:hypothetical protein